ncbi:hypothetical protein VTO42DRAFT_7418 [Malbranchea cinnamomea]
MRLMENHEKETERFHERRQKNQEEVTQFCSKIYGIAKTVLEILVAFGAEVDDTPTDIKFHIDRVEPAFIDNISYALIAATEDLFYVVCARLKVEISNIELRQSFHFDVRNVRSGQNFVVRHCLPEPKHLKLIFQGCLVLLESDSIRSVLEQELIHQQQTEFLNESVKDVLASGLHPENSPIFCKNMQSMIRQPHSLLHRLWSGLDPVYDTAPAMVLATVSEKYRGSLKNTKTEKKPENQWHLERRHILANREAAYATLCGVTVGEHRRKEGQLTLNQYLKEKLCICFGLCACARRCTEKSHRPCPCSARLALRSGIADVDLTESFSERCSDGAAAIFKTLSRASRASSVSDMAFMLAAGLDGFRKEVISFRKLQKQRQLLL